MRGYIVEGIVIKRSNLGEADKLITLFTPDFGKITLRAKSLRRPTSKQASSLDLFNLIRCQIIPSKTPLDLVTQSHLINSFSGWKKHLGRVTLAYQLAEIIDKLTPDRQPHPEVYQLLFIYLSSISSLGEDWKTITDSWLLQIVIELGFWPQEKPFTGDILAFVESLSERPIHSPKLFQKLSSK